MRQLIALIILGLTVYGVVDCARADDRDRRGIPRWAWLVVIVLLPAIGSIIWLISSRTGRADGGSTRPGPIAPDDDPQFLRELERRNRRRQQTTGESEPDVTPDDKPDNENDRGHDDS
ncbi:MAG: PLD nuclease N-terminal domain-containing protein [Beutenbergiaceae bacterium]